MPLGTDAEEARDFCRLLMQAVPDAAANQPIAVALGALAPPTTTVEGLMLWDDESFNHAATRATDGAKLAAFATAVSAAATSAVTAGVANAAAVPDDATLKDRLRRLIKRAQTAYAEKTSPVSAAATPGGGSVPASGGTGQEDAQGATEAYRALETTQNIVIEPHWRLAPSRVAALRGHCKERRALTGIPSVGTFARARTTIDSAPTAADGSRTLQIGGWQLTPKGDLLETQAEANKFSDVAANMFVVAGGIAAALSCE
jgi:hypothetical protein